VSSFRLRRLTAVVTAASLALLLLGTGTALASPPNWSMTVVKLPPTVAAGANAGYVVTVKNSGPSNIASLFLVSDATSAPSYVSTPTQGSCVSSPLLNCNFGALTAGNSVTVTVAYGVGSSNFTVTFQANTSGATFSDTRGTSHGDTLSNQVTTAVSNSQNFGGGFVVGSTTVQDNQSVGRRNLQATLVNSPEALVPVTVEDGITTGIACNGCTGHLIGEWSRLNVNNGQPYGTPFKIVITIDGSAVPGGVSASDIYVEHTLDDGTTTVKIDTTCTFSGNDPVPTNPECLNVTKVGSNFQIVLWVFRNGGYRGTF
jgi:hypothetical protein